MKRKISPILFSSVGSMIVLGILIAVLRANAQGETPKSASSVQSAGTQLGTAFTYQGQLGRKGSVVNGPFDFQFQLYDALESGVQLGPTITRVITVTNGLFTTDLDFGPVFTGTVLYLQVGVTETCTQTNNTYTMLKPRQQILSAPYALYSTTSATATLAISSLQTPWDGLTNVPAGFADKVDNDTLASLALTIKGGGDCRPIQQAIDALPSTGGQVIISADTYTCTTPIVIDRDNVTLRGQGPATMLRLADGANAPVLVLGQISTPPTITRNNIQISDLVIDGNRVNQTFECWGGNCGTGGMTDIRNNGITLRRVNDVLIERITVFGARSGGLVTEKGCRRLTIRSFTSFDNHFDGLAAYETEDSVFSDIYLYDNLAAGFSFDIRFNNNLISNVVITNSGSVGIFMRDSRDNVFYGLEIRNSTQHGVFLAQVDSDTTKPAYGNSFVAVVISNSGGAGLRVNDLSCQNNMVSASQLVGNSSGCISEVTPGLVISGTVICR